jgi:hypothetical protein
MDDGTLEQTQDDLEPIVIFDDPDDGSGGAAPADPDPAAGADSGGASGGAMVVGAPSPHGTSGRRLTLRGRPRILAWDHEHVVMLNPRRRAPSSARADDPTPGRPS